MSSNGSVPALTQVQARQLAGKRWVFQRMAYRFGNYDPHEPGQPPWKTGAEGIAYPLLGTDGFAAAYLKFFDSVKVTPKRVARTDWLIRQQVHTWIPELAGAPRVWVDTRESARADGVAFDFAGSLAQAVRGSTWLEVKASVSDGKVKLDRQFRERCVANLLRALVVLEQTGIVHGDLSPNNIIVDTQAAPGRPALFLIDFDGFAVEGAGQAIGRLEVGEGGTFGTPGYCPPELEQASKSNGLGIAPYSDRYGRDMLMLELLCFDADLDYEEPPSRWDSRRLQKRLADGASGPCLQYLSSSEVFRLPEGSRPSSQNLATALRVSTPPRVKCRTTASSISAEAGGSRGWGAQIDRITFSVVVVLWILCVAHCGLLSFMGADWVLRLAGKNATLTSERPAVTAAVYVATSVGLFILGVSGVSYVAFAEAEAQSVQASRICFQMPRRRLPSALEPWRRPVVIGELLGILGALSGCLAWVLSMLP